MRTHEIAKHSGSVFGRGMAWRCRRDYPRGVESQARVFLKFLKPSGNVPRDSKHDFFAALALFENAPPCHVEEVSSRSLINDVMALTVTANCVLLIRMLQRVPDHGYLTVIE